jgi:hypothetical protein
LCARGLDALLVTSEALVFASRWEHRVASDGRSSFEVTLPDGAVVRDEAVAGVINRLAGVPASYLARAEEGDRQYVEQEWRALLASALHALVAAGAPVIEEPDPFALAGRWRSPAEWLCLAAAAGLPAAPWRWAEGPAPPPAPAWPAAEGSGMLLLVIGDRVIPTVPVPPATEAAARRLARRAGVTTLQVDLALDAGAEAPRFVAAGPIRDPRLGGEAALDALTTLLDRGRP